jgi:hypothetical protein
MSVAELQRNAVAQLQRLVSLAFSVAQLQRLVRQTQLQRLVSLAFSAVAQLQQLV